MLHKFSPDKFKTNTARRERLKMKRELYRDIEKNRKQGNHIELKVIIISISKDNYTVHLR
jgi:hypothetical protein